METTRTVQLSEDLRAALAEIAQRQDRSASEVVCDSLRRYVAREKFQWLRNKVLPFAEAQGILTDDDVFKTVT